MKRPACGRFVPVTKTAVGHDGYECAYERMKGKQMCVWHWLLRQPADAQKTYAERRRAITLALGDVVSRVPKEKWPDGERWCSGCQSFVPLFYVQGSRCRSCNSEASHGARVEKVYGITAEQYASLFKNQGGRCYICLRQTKKRLAVDHDHVTGRVRGLLCADNDRGCNHAILGNIRDLAMAKRIVEYLEDPPFDRMMEGRDRFSALEMPQNQAEEAASGPAWGPAPF